MAKPNPFATADASLAIGRDGLERAAAELNTLCPSSHHSIGRRTNPDGSVVHVLESYPKGARPERRYTPEEIADNERWLNGHGETQTKLRSAGLACGALIQGPDGKVRYA